MKVYFIGIGPGGADLVTLRGVERLRRSRVVIYASRVVPEEILAHCLPGAERHDVLPREIDRVVAIVEDARARGLDVARLHNGDTSLYTSLPEQIERLDRLDIPWEVVPGVSSYAAAAARLGAAFTKPGVSETLILTRLEGHTPLPATERLEALAVHRSSMAIFMGVAAVGRVVEALVPHYGPEAPAAVVHRLGWPEEGIEAGTLREVAERVRGRGWKRQGLILVGEALAAAALRLNPRTSGSRPPR